MTLFAHATHRPLRNFAALAHAESHALGLGESAKRRRVRDGARASAFIINDDGKLMGSWEAPVGEVSHLCEALKRHKKRTGATERKNAAVAMHLILGVSKGSFPEGALDDPNSKTAQRYLQTAILFAEKEFGKGSVIAARRDLDERGDHAIDLIVAPVRMLRAGRGQPKPRIAVSKAMVELAKRYGRQKSYSALQDAWHAAAVELNPEIQRGRPIEETGREHLHADLYRDVADRTQEEVQADLATLERRRQNADETEQHAQRIVEAKAQELADSEKRLAKVQAELADAEAKLNQLQRAKQRVEAWLRGKWMASGPTREAVLARYGGG